MSSSRRLRNANAAALMKIPTMTRAVGAVSPVRGAEPVLELGIVFGVLFTVVVYVVIALVVVASVSIAVELVVVVVSVVVLVRLSDSAV